MMMIPIYAKVQVGPVRIVLLFINTGFISQVTSQQSSAQADVQQEHCNMKWSLTL